MASRSPLARARAIPSLLAIAGWIAAGSLAIAGDEDLSPNAYQEFDPVTGFMVIVDPDADTGHGDDTAAQASDDVEPDAAGTVDDTESGPAAWLYWVIVGVAAVGVIAWLRKKATALGD